MRTATIDGRQIEVEDGETILAASRRAGSDVPTLCLADGCRPLGRCRLCLVEVDGAASPVASCHTPIEPGMDVRTSTPHLERLRRSILGLLVEAHTEGDFRSRTSELGVLLERFGQERGPRASGTSGVVILEDHPYLRFDPRLCITCRRCIRVCEEVQGQFVFGVTGRGSGTRLVLGASESFLESDCTSCGACVDTCPTRALYDVDCARGGGGETTVVSTCGYCSVGCGVEVTSAAGRVERIRGVPSAAVNRGHLCAKGRYAHAHHRAGDRLRRPLLREGDGWRELTWDEAVSTAAEGLGAIRDEHGPAALGALTSARSTNEAAYLLQKLFRAGIGTNNVDGCTRVCHSSTALALQLSTGIGAATASFADVERARAIVVIGANPTESHPVIGARIKQAALRGALLVVIDPRRIELARYADHFLALRPGSNVSLLNALAREILERGLQDRSYLRSRTDGLEGLGELLGGLDPESLSRECGVGRDAIEATAAALGGAGPILFVHGLGLSEQLQGTGSVLALCNLALLTGSIGRRGAGMLPLGGQNNLQGATDMGGLPDRITGHQPVDDPMVRARVRDVWGVEPPAEPGLTLPEMLAAAGNGTIRAMWIQGEDIVRSDPDESRVLSALASLELLVVQDLFLTETARWAHLVLPAAGALEQDGTFTSGERRIQLVRAAVPPPGEARSDWEVIRDVGNALGLDQTLGTASDVLDEVARVAPHLFGGVSHARLEGDGLQWPCPEPGHPGTPTLHVDGFGRGRGRMHVVEPESNPEHDVAGFPYLLVTGRVLHHYNVGAMTRRTPQVDLWAEDRLEIHPDDASREGIGDGDPVELESRWGRARGRALLSARVSRGELFLSFHFPGTHANHLVGPHEDPLSGCPQYKATAVRLHT